MQESSQSRDVAGREDKAGNFTSLELCSHSVKRGLPASFSRTCAARSVLQAWSPVARARRTIFFVEFGVESLTNYSTCSETLWTTSKWGPPDICIVGHFAAELFKLPFVVARVILAGRPVCTLPQHAVKDSICVLIVMISMRLRAEQSLKMLVVSRWAPPYDRYKWSFGAPINDG